MTSVAEHYLPALEDGDRIITGTRRGRVYFVERIDEKCYQVFRRERGEIGTDEVLQTFKYKRNALICALSLCGDC